MNRIQNQDLAKKIERVLFISISSFALLGVYFLYKLYDFQSSSSGSGFTLSFIITAIVLTGICSYLFIQKSKLVNSINTSLNQIHSALKDISDGKIKTRVKVEEDGEFTDLAKAINTLAEKYNKDILDTVTQLNGNVVVNTRADVYKEFIQLVSDAKQMMNDMKAFSDNIKSGKFAWRAECGNYSGNFKVLMNDVNEAIELAAKPVLLAAQCFEEISKGKIPEYVKADFPGDLNMLKAGINSMVERLNTFDAQISHVIQLNKNGESDKQIDIKEHPGIFGKIAGDINSLVNFYGDAKIEVSSVLFKYSNGDFSADIVDLPGDMKMLSDSIHKVKETLISVKNEIISVAEAASQGNLSLRGNEEKFENSFRDMVKGINNVFSTIIAPLNTAAQCIEMIGKGEIPSTITEDYKGDFNKIKESINSCITGLDGLKEASQVLGLMSNNDYTRNVGGQSVGIFANMRESVNKLLLRLNAVQNVLIQVSNGDLGKLEFYKSIGRSCENDKLVPSMVTMMSSIKALVEEISGLTVTALDGNLSVRADVDKHNGIYKNVIEGVNATLDAVVTPLRMAANYVEKIGNGEIPGKITAEYKGEINIIKGNLNKCILAVNLLAQDAEYLASSALEGKLETRADVMNHGGDFRKIVEGMNATLDAVVTPIKEGVEALAKMAEGDFTIKIHSDYKGDHQLIKNSINSVCNEMNKALNNVSEAISATASACNQISASTEEMAAGVNEQTMQTAEVAGGVEQMTKTILENSKNASFATEAAKDAGLKAKEGGEVVKETISGMIKIAEVVKKSADTVHLLGKSSDQIGEIVQVIDDIADQTNLLALNAAIEAARAGEQGRGFAVVADEVRKLAERTTKATKEIAMMIRQIQKDTAEAVHSMKEGTDEVERGKSLANKAGEALSEIVMGSEKVVDIVAQVAAASEQQSSAAEQISRNIETISSSAQQSAVGTEQIARAAEDMNRLTVNLEELIHRFQLNSNATKNYLAGPGNRNLINSMN